MEKSNLFIVFTEWNNATKDYLTKLSININNFNNNIEKYTVENNLFLFFPDNVAENVLETKLKEIQNKENYDCYVALHISNTSNETRKMTIEAIFPGAFINEFHHNNDTPSITPELIKISEKNNIEENINTIIKKIKGDLNLEAVLNFLYDILCGSIPTVYDKKIIKEKYVITFEEEIKNEDVFSEKYIKALKVLRNNLFTSIGIK